MHLLSIRHGIVHRNCWNWNAAAVLNQVWAAPELIFVSPHLKASLNDNGDPIPVQATSANKCFKEASQWKLDASEFFRSVHSMYVTFKSEIKHSTIETTNKQIQKKKLRILGKSVQGLLGACSSGNEWCLFPVKSKLWEAFQSSLKNITIQLFITSTMQTLKKALQKPHNVRVCGTKTDSWLESASRIYHNIRNIWGQTESWRRLWWKPEWWGRCTLHPWLREVKPFWKANFHSVYL